jgi:hypothetical protein
MKTHILKILILGFIIFSSCKENSVDALPDEQKLSQLKTEIETFAKNKACSGGDNCRVVGIGSKPCGGPAEYLIYSLTNTDEKQLIAKVNEYNILAKAYNDKNPIVSNCIAEQPPTIDCLNGVCTKK